MEVRSRRSTALLVLWAGAVVVVSAQATIAHNNNWEIFRWSWLNLLAGNDLYALNAHHRDYFNYSPTFALLFAPFAVVPMAVGVLVWTTLNAAALYWGLGRVLSSDAAFVARAIVLVDAIGAMQNVQSNGLVAGSMLIAFAELERRREPRAALAIGLGAAIKIFPIAAVAFSIFRPYRVPRFTLWCVIVAVVLVSLPLVVIPPATLVDEYRSWANVLGQHDRGYSIMSHVRMWLDTDLAKWPIQLLGLVVLLAPLVQVSHWGSARFRLLFLASTLMFCVLFNPGAESPTFVIAVTGVAIWFVCSTRDRFAWTVLGIVFVGTTLASSEAMPAVLRQQVFVPYKLKTLPILLAWVVTQIELWRRSVSAPFPDRVSASAAPAR